ncbi:type IV secretory system conjugative DNA transfer family protein, partial [Methylobacterium sp. Gmos1]
PDLQRCLLTHHPGLLPQKEPSLRPGSGFNRRLGQFHIGGYNGTRYDPLGILQPDSIHFGGQIKRLCISLMPDPADPKGEHFVRFSRLWVGGVIAQMVRYRREEASFFNCIMKATCKGEELKSLLEEMEHNPDPVVQLGARAYFGVAGGERASYMTTMATHLENFMSVPLCMITNPGEDEAKAFIMKADGSGIDRGWTFEQVFRDSTPTAFIVRGSDSAVTGAFLRLLITNAYETRKRMMGEGFVFKRAFWAYLDEAPTVGKCQAVVEMNDLMRKALMRVCLFFQTYQQLQNTYGDKAETLFASCTLVVCGIAQDHRLYEVISRTIGHQKVQKTTITSGNGGQSINVSEAWERTSTPERMRQHNDKWTILMDGGQVELNPPYWDKNGRRYY